MINIFSTMTLQSLENSSKIKDFKARLIDRFTRVFHWRTYTNLADPINTTT
jgi:hypothetical protein